MQGAEMLCLHSSVWDMTKHLTKLKPLVSCYALLPPTMINVCCAPLIFPKHIFLHPSEIEVSLLGTRPFPSWLLGQAAEG